MNLVLATQAWETLRSAAEAGYPLEVCGILLGPAGQTGPQRRVSEAVACGNLNVERARDRYQMDPLDQLRVERDARQRGLETLGYYHSHPDHPADASATDLELSWEGVHYLIVSVRDGRVADQRAWYRAPGQARFQRQSLTRD